MSSYGKQYEAQMQQQKNIQRTTKLFTDGGESWFQTIVSDLQHIRRSKCTILVEILFYVRENPNTMLERFSVGGLMKPAILRTLARGFHWFVACLQDELRWWLGLMNLVRVLAWCQLEQVGVVACVFFAALSR